MNNGPLHTKFQVLRHVVESAAEADIGAFFYNRQTTIPRRTTIKYLGHEQFPTPIEIVKPNALGVVNYTVKKEPNQ